MEPAADDVEVIVDEPRQGAATLQVDHIRCWPGERHDLVIGADRDEAAIGDRDRADSRFRPIQRVDQAAMQYEIGRVSDGHFDASDEVLSAGSRSKMWGSRLERC